jgi:hypothetical protein
VVTDDGRPIILDRHYLDAGHVTHGYAITGHKAQGLTVEHTYVLGSEALYREWGYVALSRGRQTNRLYQTVLDQQLDEIHTHVHQPDDPHAALAARMARTRAQEPVTPRIRELGAQWRDLHAQLHEPDIGRQRALASERASLVRTRQADVEQLDGLTRRIDSYASGLGSVRNHRLLGDLRSEQAARSASLARLDQQIDEVDRELATLPSDARIADLQARWRDLGYQIDAAGRRCATAYRHEAPDYLMSALGPPPADRRGRERWQQAAVTIEDYRLRWNVTDPNRPLGPPPTNPLEQASHRQVVATIARHRREQHLEREGSRGLGISLSR